jgi:excisionase family DNA binding protein
MKLTELPQLISVSSVSEQYGIPKKEIYGWIKNNRILCYKFGPRLIRFAVNDVELLIKNQRLNKERKSL